MSSQTSHPAPGRGNRLLELLSPKAYEGLLPHCETVGLAQREVLYESFQPIPYIHFPTSGVLAVVKQMHSGDVVEVMTIGCEGMSGMTVLFGGESSSARCIVYVAGSALRISAGTFRSLDPIKADLYDVLGRYALVALNQVGQGLACNQLHSTEQRCARWLLATGDRADVSEFALTHEFLAFMLGVRRATVTQVEGRLRAAGLIESSRGHVRIIDRAGLEAVSCECYQAVRAEYLRVLGVPA